MSERCQEVQAVGTADTSWPELKHVWPGEWQVLKHWDDVPCNRWCQIPACCHQEEFLRRQGFNHDSRACCEALPDLLPWSYSKNEKCFVKNQFRMCWEVTIEFDFTVLQAQELMPTELIKAHHPWSCFTSDGLLFLVTTHFLVLKLRFFRLVAGTAHASPAGDLRAAVARRAGPAGLLALSYPCAIQRTSRVPVCMVSSPVVPLALLNMLTTGGNLLLLPCFSPVLVTWDKAFFASSVLFEIIPLSCLQPLPFLILSKTSRCSEVVEQKGKTLLVKS